MTPDSDAPEALDAVVSGLDHVAIVVASIDEAAVQDVVGHVGGGMAEVGGVVGRNPADVDPHYIVDDQRRNFPGRRVIYRHVSHRTTLASTAAKARPASTRRKMT